MVIFVWWLLIQIIGLAALPLAFRVFRGLPDRGYALSKPLGLLLTGYMFWLLVTFKFLRNTAGGVLFALAVMAGFSVWVGRKALWPASAQEQSLWAWLREHWRVVLVTEALLAVALAGWSWYRAYSPELATAGGEKFMEYAFLNAVLRSETFPPHDPWLSGFAISYYFFGYIMMAMLTRLSGFPVTYTFNVAVALLFALTVTGSFSLVYNLVDGLRKTPVSSLAYGVLGSVLVAFVGNLEGLFEVLHSRGLLPASFWVWLDLKDLNVPPVPGSWIPSRFIWWWRASRVIHDRDPLGGSMEVIDEFPFFSFMLGDMHPHVLALPFVMLALGLALSVLLPVAGRRSPVSGNRFRLASILPLTACVLPELGAGGFVLVALCLGALGFLNTWDFPIYLLVVVLAWGARRYLEGQQLDGALVWESGLVGVLLLAAGVILYLPFYIGFQSQAGGVLPTLFVSTRFSQYLVMFGLFLFVLVVWLGVLLRQALAEGQLDGRRLLRLGGSWFLGLILVPSAAMAVTLLPLFFTRKGQEFLQSIRTNEVVQQFIAGRNWGPVIGELVLARLRNPWMALFVALLLALIVVVLWSQLRHSREATQTIQPSLVFTLILAGVGLLLTFGPEWVYLRDSFGTRMNTIFKFYYQGWVCMAIASAFAVAYLNTAVNRQPSAASGQRSVIVAPFNVGFALLLCAALIYPVLAMPNRAGGFDHPPSLDGAAWIRQAHPDDYTAAQWLNATVPDAPVILEASGGSYSYFGRVAAQTGLPTVLGWDFHELQWRGTYDEPGKRKPEIEKLYQTLDIKEAQALLDKWNVSYVYVGRQEREAYHLTQPQIDKFDIFMDRVYDHDGVRIYRRRAMP